eukprot:GEMP01025518.1.p1 GENE.GEMP01025518.1~~GEMP01025518.1.p1  ORF type:complete len:412 (+),score=116.75 GEMP01025518.1:261-1496(+)
MNSEKASLIGAAVVQSIENAGNELAGAPDNHYTMFHKEDATSWLVFSVAFVVLIVFDNIVIFRTHQTITVGYAALYTLFWICCAGCFAMYIFHSKGSNAAFDWTSGYLLEWMLSFDNLFVFHLIFQIYATPDHLKHKPLFWGICGAVFFRLLFIFIGEFLMHAIWAAHLVFGAFLVYTGIHSALVDEDDVDPTENCVVQWLCKRVPFIPCYDAKGNFFVRVPIDDNGVAVLPETVTKKEGLRSDDDAERTLIILESGDDKEPTYGAAELRSASKQFQDDQQKYGTRATMLFLVVCCLEISDILFAVDSTSAIVAQVSDLYLAYTSAVFAMLGLRATFFIIDVLVKIFSLLKYGVATVLVFIGIKLIISKVYHIPPMVVCGILFGTLAVSIVWSVLLDHFKGGRKSEDAKAA